MKHTDTTKQKISETCKKNGIGKWMLGKKMSLESCIKRSDKMAKRIANGKHNFYIDGRTKLPCPDCGKVKWRSSEKCRDCGHTRGENHPMWKGGITPFNHLIRNSTPSKIWNINVKTRDNFKCKIANKDCSGKLEAHHILSFAKFPELRFDINNGITLCRFHHPLKESEARQKSPYFTSLIQTIQ